MLDRESPLKRKVPTQLCSGRLLDKPSNPILLTISMLGIISNTSNTSRPSTRSHPPPTLLLTTKITK